MNEQFKYGDITEKIIGCAMRVHSAMKNGHREAVYQRCLSIEMRKMGLHFKEEADMPIYFGDHVVGHRRLDFLVEQTISVELKAHTEILNEHMAQAINNLEIHRLEVGLLLNFGAKSLQVKRLINQKFRYHPKT